jgi:hypothetical protein
MPMFSEREPGASADQLTAPSCELRDHTGGRRPKTKKNGDIGSF